MMSSDIVSQNFAESSRLGAPAMGTTQADSSPFDGIRKYIASILLMQKPKFNAGDKVNYVGLDW